MFRESYKSAMNEIETNKELFNSLLEKADETTVPQKEKFTAIKKLRVYTLSGLAAAAAAMIVAFGIKDYKAPIENADREIPVPRIASEETEEAATVEMAVYDGTKNTPLTENEKLRKEDYFGYIGINIENLKLPSDLKWVSEDEINILKDENGKLINDYHTFSFKGDGERYVGISTATTKEADIGWIKTVSDKNYSSTYSVKNGTAITVECYMLKEEEQKALLDSFNN